ncbi:acyl-CoA thioesterase [Flavobacterium silvaticum]|uniref:Acyl-CoA thioesterase n=1 Tax=Flavobacterium silvaticum TaxID=1852020 RepID=A0A972FLD5_9FLAO|nr:acyl-CoA thioesterase [Flavobacterium silvaticum]NMH28126.1 acyl-CoA thioesterase [Flavobacterium silvaticum]
MSDPFKSVNASKVTISELMLPSHSNFSGKIHGGYILMLMDQIAFACASKFSGHYCVTASVETVDFLNPIEIGELVTMKASVNYVGRSSMVVGIRVDSENIRTGKVKHCNSSYFTMVAKDDSAQNIEVPGLILASPDDIRRFYKAVHRIQSRKSNADHSDTFDSTTKEAIDNLSNYRVQLKSK